MFTTLSDTADSILERIAEEDVQRGARRIVWEDKAEWARDDADNLVLETPDGEVVLAIYGEDGDGGFSAYSPFWRLVEN